MSKTLVSTFFCFGTLLLIAVLIISNSYFDIEKYSIHGDIDCVEVISTESGRESLIATNKAHILILSDCLRGIALNNLCQSFTRKVSMAPQEYRITFRFTDGKIKTHFYTVYPAVKHPASKYNQPLKPFFDLYGYY